MIEVSRSVVIDAPVGVVQAQFGDVAHHERGQHHRGVRFHVLEDGPTACDYEQRTRVGPFTVRQRFHLERGDPARQVNELIEGAFAPGSITFEIVADEHGHAQVTATVRSERGGLQQLVAPMVRRMLGRALVRSLDEDRVDIESGVYTRSSAA